MIASVVLIAGGMGISGLLIEEFDIDGSWTGHGAYFLGALFGGFTVGRASPALTLLEPALAGFLLTGMLFGVFGLSPESAVTFIEGTRFDMLYEGVRMGAISLLGGLTGALAGERMTPATATRLAIIDEPVTPSAALWHMWVALLSYVGCLIIAVALMIMISQQPHSADEHAPGVFVSIVLFAPFFSGYLAMFVNRYRGVSTAASGPFSSMLLLGLLVYAVTDMQFHLVFFIAIGGAALSVLALAGAGLSLRIGEWWRRGEPEPVELPSARIAAPSQQH